MKRYSAPVLLHLAEKQAEYGFITFLQTCTYTQRITPMLAVNLLAQICYHSHKFTDCRFLYKLGDLLPSGRVYFNFMRANSKKRFIILNVDVLSFCGGLVIFRAAVVT